MAGDMVKMVALRTHSGSYGFVRKGASFVATEREARGLERLRRPLAERAATEAEAAALPAVDEAGPLSGVDFASDEAAEFAAENGLQASDFEGVEMSGATGFTKADVRKLAERKG